MKRLSCIAVLVLFCISIFAISVNPSMDGRAVVADAGVFPPGGFYGRAPGYLPGDTVIVTNHSNGFSIDVLILGSYDAYEGIAILLSPEAAEKLQIIKGKDVYVKVQKKQPISYEEAVATSRNKKAEQKQSVDTDKDSSVLPGDTEQLVNEVIESNKQNSEPVELESEETEVADVSEPEEETTEELVELAEIQDEEIVEDEDVILADNSTFVTEENTEEDLSEELAELEPEEDNLLAENVSEDVIDSSEEELLAEPEEYVESESIDSPVLEVAKEESVEPTEEEVEEVVETPEEEEVVLDDLEDEELDEGDFIDTPVESEVAELETEEELPVEEVASAETELEPETEDYLEPVEEELAEVPEDIESNEMEEAEVALEDVTSNEEDAISEEELEEVLVSEEEIAEIAPEEEIISSEILSTDDETELAVLDDCLESEEPTNTVSENPKDIFSMIVGDDLDENIIEDVVLEESEPKLPEVIDEPEEELASSADFEIKLEEPEANIPEIVAESEPVAVVKNTTVTTTNVSNPNVKIDGFANIVADFKDLPKVKNAKSSTYYIQIATVNKKENVAKMIDLHGKKYPVYVIKNPAKSSYQILVGPLNDDEYALVLARFKQTYKDAFIRIAK